MGSMSNLMNRNILDDEVFLFSNGSLTDILDSDSLFDLDNTCHSQIVYSF